MSFHVLWFLEHVLILKTYLLHAISWTNSICPTWISYTQFIHNLAAKCEISTWSFIALWTSMEICQSRLRITGYAENYLRPLHSSHPSPSSSAWMGLGTMCVQHGSGLPKGLKDIQNKQILLKVTIVWFQISSKFEFKK